MSAQPAGSVAPPEILAAGAIQSLSSGIGIGDPELVGSTEPDLESYREAFERSLLTRQEILTLLPSVPALRSLGLGFRLSYQWGSGVISISPHEEVEQTFNQLAQRWRAETLVQSSPHIFSHRLYLQIIGMGREIVPILLCETRRDPGEWFLALQSITRQDPVKAEDAGNVDAMAKAWLDWGRQQGYDV